VQHAPDLRCLAWGRFFHVDYRFTQRATKFRAARRHHTSREGLLTEKRQEKSATTVAATVTKKGAGAEGNLRSSLTRRLEDMTNRNGDHITAKIAEQRGAGIRMFVVVVVIPGRFERNPLGDIKIECSQREVIVAGALS
jgi:hypothetical protein